MTMGPKRGINEEEMKLSVETLENMAKQLGAKVSEAFERKTGKKNAHVMHARETSFSKEAKQSYA